MCVYARKGCIQCVSMLVCVVGACGSRAACGGYQHLCRSVCVCVALIGVGRNMDRNCVAMCVCVCHIVSRLSQYGSQFAFVLQHVCRMVCRSGCVAVCGSLGEVSGSYDVSVVSLRIVFVAVRIWCKCVSRYALAVVVHTRRSSHRCGCMYSVCGVME